MRKVCPLIPKGFTLLELLITVGIFALIGTTALVGLVKTQDQFAFRNATKGSANIIREVRSFAMGNKTIESVPPSTSGELPYQYGAYIDLAGNKITTFGDKNDAGKNKFDLSTDATFDTFELDAGYKYEVYDENLKATNQGNITLFYKPTNADFHIAQEGVPQLTGRYVAIRIYDTKNISRESYIVLFTLSGNPETFNSLTDVTN